MSDAFIDGLKKENILFEDDVIIIYLPDKPMTNGHLKVFTKKEYKSLEELDDDTLEEIVFASSYCATSLFEYFGGQVGTNIMCNNVSFLNDRVTFDILARKEGDGVDFQWKPKQMKPDEMDAVVGKIKDKADLIGHEVKTEEKPKDLDKDEDVEKIKPKDGEEDYVIKSLTRIP